MRNTLNLHREFAFKDNSFSLLLVVPVYNVEADVQEVINRVIDTLGKYNLNFRLLVVDDCSSDGTFSKAQNLKNSVVEARRNLSNLGKGLILKEGLRNSSATYVGFIDGDLDIDPVSLLWAIEALESDFRIDVVIGSKIHPLSEVQYPPSRRLLSYVYRKIIKKIFSLSVTDTQTGIKIFRNSDCLNQLLKVTKSNNFSFDLEILSLMEWKGLKIVEVPVLLKHNFTSSIGIRSIIEMLVDIFKILFSLFFLRYGLRNLENS